MSTPSNTRLIAAAVSAEPEQINAALENGANPFFVDVSGESGYGALARWSNLMTDYPSPDHLGGRLKQALHNMNQVPFQEENAQVMMDLAVRFEEKASESRHLNKLTLAKAGENGIALDSVTSGHFKNQENADELVRAGFRNSAAFLALEQSLSETDKWLFQERLTNARDFGPMNAKMQLGLMDMQDDGKIQVRASMPAWPDISVASELGSESSQKNKSIDPFEPYLTKNQNQGPENGENPNTESENIDAPRLTMKNLRQSLEAKRDENKAPSLDNPHHNIKMKS